MSEQTFVHAPLAQPSDFRLIEVIPAPSTDEIICTRVHVRSLDGADSQTPYTALSYTWGDPEDTVPIRLDGKRFHVTRNLDSALRRFRDDVTTTDSLDPKPLQESSRDSAPWPSNLLWVDALSIDQSNNAEKSAQVTRLPQIYTSATAIFAWLGPEESQSPLAFSKIRAALARYRLLAGPSPPDAVPRWAAGMLADELMLCDDDEDDAAIWLAVQALFDREWWSRVWVAQEGSTNVPTFVVCGANRLPLEDVLTFAVLMGINAQDDEDAASRVYGISSFVYTLHTLRSQRRAGTSESDLLNTLISCRPYDATDPRDKVYGILGMVSPRASSRLLPDYARDLVDVYTDVVQYQLETSGYESKLDFLGADGLPEGGMTGLPSWLPDWRYRDRYHLPFRKFLNDEACTPRPGRRATESAVYAASGTAEALLNLNISISDIARIDGRCLRLKGYRVGYLYDVQPVFEPGRPEVMNTWRDALRQGLYFTGEPEAGAFNRLITADIHHGVRTEPSARDISPEDVLAACSGRRLARVVQKDWNTDGLALVPQCVREGDQIFVLLGGQVLYALRPVGEMYRFLGECYVHGLMDGEVLDILETGLARVADLVLR